MEEPTDSHSKASMIVAAKTGAKGNPFDYQKFVDKMEKRYVSIKP